MRIGTQGGGGLGNPIDRPPRWWRRTFATGWCPRARRRPTTVLRQFLHHQLKRLIGERMQRAEGVERAGGHFVDMRSAFDTEAAATYAEDAVHYNALGNRILAETLASSVVAALGER